jgi:hypothetical protein
MCRRNSITASLNAALILYTPEDRIAKAHEQSYQNLKVTMDMDIKT